MDAALSMLLVRTFSYRRHLCPVLRLSFICDVPALRDPRGLVRVQKTMLTLSFNYFIMSNLMLVIIRSPSRQSICAVCSAGNMHRIPIIFVGAQ
jgi:hypothetical protein